MRRALLSALLALAACASTPSKPDDARVDTSAQTAAAGDQAPLTEGDVTTATFDGMRIIVKRTPGAEFAAGQLFVLGGVRNWAAENAGVEALAVNVATSGGTTKLDKDAFARRLATLGAEVGGSSGDDYAVYACKSLLGSWDETFGLMADSFLTPALPASELEIARARQLAALRHEVEDPDSRLGMLARLTVFANHPYAKRAIGTEASVTAVKPADLAPHLAKLREKSRLVLVVVGDLDPAHVIDQAKKAFATVPRGGYVDAPLPKVTFSAPKLTTEERKQPTNYIEGWFAGPSWKDADVAVGMVTMRVLNERLFEEVRTKRNLSYAPGAGMRSGSEEPMGWLYVTAVDPNTTVGVMLDEAKKLQTEAVPAKELEGGKSTFLTGLLEGNETVDGQAGFLGRAAIYGGDWHLAKSLPERVRAVTAADVQKFAQSRIHNLQFFELGDPTKADPKLFQSL